MGLLVSGLLSRKVSLPARRFSSLIRQFRRGAFALVALASVLAFNAVAAFAAPAGEAVGGEAALKLPDLSDVTFFGGLNGRTLLMVGLAVCVLGLLFGLAIYMNLKKLPVHRAMREI